MFEYLIRRTDGDWFDLDPKRYEIAFRPSSIKAERVDGWGSWRILCSGIEISFSDEEAGIQISFEGEVSRELADQIASEICQNIEFATGQSGRVVPLQ
jgi:hypothetical protein